MAGHVPAIGQECHGAENPAGKDFHGHGDNGQPEDKTGPAFAVISLVAMVMVAGTGMVVHVCLFMFDDRIVWSSNRYCHVV